jgi:hypothetical protein
MLPSPQVAHVNDSRNFHAQGMIGPEINPRTEPPFGDNDTELLECTPSAAHLVESCSSQVLYTNDVESGSLRNELTPSDTGIPYYHKLQKLLGAFPVTKSIQTRIRRLRKLPHIVRAIQARIEQVAKIPHVVRVLQASMAQMSKIPLLVQSMGHHWTVSPSDSNTTPSAAVPSKWCCFICVDISGRETVAMKIPCPSRKPRLGSKDRETKIYETIKQSLTIYYGMSRFLPFYGVKGVQEVNV